MSPEPDHGEDTYRRSGRLAGRRALITEGDSGIGRAVAIAYAREGADVALSYRPEDKLTPTSRPNGSAGPADWSWNTTGNATRCAIWPQCG